MRCKCCDRKLTNFAKKIKDKVVLLDLCTSCIGKSYDSKPDTEYVWGESCELLAEMFDNPEEVKEMKD